jgi:hypothetical protein
VTGTALFPPPPIGTRCPACSGWFWWQSRGSAWTCWGCSPGPGNWQADPAIELFNSQGVCSIEVA